MAKRKLAALLPPAVTTEQKLAIIKEAASQGLKVTLDKHDVYPATYYNWKRQLAEQGEEHFGKRVRSQQIRQLQQLEKENRQLKELVAEKELLAGLVASRKVKREKLIFGLTVPRNLIKSKLGLLSSEAGDTHYNQETEGRSKPKAEAPSSKKWSFSEGQTPKFITFTNQLSTEL
ncbi:transposase [Neolewinella lacunae]|uniref:Transposase n=1 Tax=Neolewinella lacunae TaxID=1517758 RepID=A0A923PLJ4_9BACT|nr:transposase [Neolewinella lacunae]MBC6994941.1 transposase [Neolewinella lacunae]MDN3636115.1 transposase [Neolewinella lacunae]